MYIIKNTIEARKTERKFNLYFSFARARDPRGIMISWCVRVCVCIRPIYFSFYTHIRTLCVYARSCFISSSSSSPCPVLCLSAIHRCRHTTLILKRQNKCVNLSINSFIHSFNTFFFLLSFIEKTTINK